MYTLPTSLPYVDLLPGPFILLIFIPLLPLALFSLGARPPTGSSFDFLTDELWRTTALLGIAVTVGLCVGVYPSTLEGMGGWLKSGNLNWGSNHLGLGSARSWFGSPATVPGVVPVGRRVVRRAKPSFDRIARNHITALRYYYPRLYRPTTPKSTSVLLLGIIITLSTIVITGKILKAIYESDTPRVTRSAAPPSSSDRPSGWVSKEYEARKKDENEEATRKRYKEEEAVIATKIEGRKTELGEEKFKRYVIQKSGERKKDLEMLKKMLKKKGLEPFGLDVVPPWYIDLDPDPVAVGVVGDVAVKETKEVKAEKEKDGTVQVKDVEAKTMGDKIREALLGKTLAQARKKEKVAAASASPSVVVMDPGTSARPFPVAAAAAVPERGPGWEVASDRTAGAGLATSAGNAEALARVMGK